MNPDKKYMSQRSFENDDIKFVPPVFSYNKTYNEAFIKESSRNLDLFPSTSGFPELCYYSEDPSDILNRDFGMNIVGEAVPTTFDILKNLDLDLDENKDLERANSDDAVNKIYLKIEQRHPGIFAALYAYRIPRPIVRVIIKRLIRLTLSYCDNR